MRRFILFCIIGLYSFFIIEPVFAQANSTVRFDNIDLIKFAPIIVSIVAICFSVFTFWKNYLSPFNLETTYTSPTLRIYTIGSNNVVDVRQLGIEHFLDTQEEKDEIDPKKFPSIWWIPCIDIGLSFYNIGQKTGKLIDIRFRGEIISKDKKIKKEIIFYSQYIVNYKQFHIDAYRFFKWTNTSIDEAWHPRIIPGKSIHHVHLVLKPSMRWDEKLFGELTLELEILYNKKWKKVSEFKLTLDDFMYDYFAGYRLSSELDLDRFNTQPELESQIENAIKKTELLEKKD